MCINSCNVVVATSKDEYISNNEYIGDISTDILIQNIDKPNIYQNL